MMSQMDQRAHQVQRKVQSMFEGQFELGVTQWGTQEELSEMIRNDARIHYMGIVLIESGTGELMSVGSQISLPVALEENPDAKTLMIAGRARNLQINSDGAGLKLFNLIGFEV